MSALKPENQTDHPLVSVVVATRRRDRELRRALLSLAAQTYRPLEIILCDDNADPQWNARAAAEAADVDFGTDCRLIHLQNPRQLGSAETRNAGIRAASGEYVTFLDDDDEYLPEKIAEQAAFVREKNLDYSITDLCLFREDGSPAGRRVRPCGTFAAGKDLLRCHLTHHLTGTDTLMFRREYLLEIGGFPPIDLGDEFYLMCAAIQGGGRFGYLSGCGVRAYLHKGGGMSTGDTKIAGENALYEFKKQYFGELDRAAVRFIKTRHYAVLAFVCLRQKRILYALGWGCRAFFTSPGSFFRLLKENV